MNSRHLERERDDREDGQDLFNEFFSAAAAHRAVGTVNSMKELRGRYGRERHGFIAQLLQEIR